MLFKALVCRWGLLTLLALVFPTAASSALPLPAAPDGAALYQQRCASCHDNPDTSSRAPLKAALGARGPDTVLAVLTEGVMKPMAEGLGPAELDALVVHLAGTAPSHAAAAPATDPDLAAACPAASAPATAGPAWNGWSPTLDNARYSASAGLGARDVPKLKVKWSFAFAGGVGGQPTVVGGRVYLGTGAGRVYALDAQSGCMHWRAQIEGAFRSAVTVGALAGPADQGGRLAVFAGDRSGGMHAFDAANGEELWSVKLETNPFATVTGSPVLYQGRLYVPMSSTEEIAPFVPGYQCCKFRGQVIALDAASGAELWRTYTIKDEPAAYRTAPDGTPVFGPAGAAVWSAPTIDPERGLLYVATGDSYTDAPNSGSGSDAVIAMDLLTGEERWVRQITENDNFLVGCTGKEGQPSSCPLILGPDHDFGASPILVDLPGGRSVLMVGQKSGEVSALDPADDGALLWQTRFGQGGALGGIEWGMATDGELLFVPIADPYTPVAEARRGMFAVRVADGSVAWGTPAPEPDCAIAPKGSLIGICTSGLSSAPTAFGGVVVEGSMDGILRAYDAKDGTVVWSFDVGQAMFQPLNAAAPMKGDTMNSAGASVAGGALFQISGYQASNPRAMNLLLAFTVDGK
jgi:polyvinyl alcohol dehydrogenase (cytochrome)